MSTSFEGFGIGPKAGEAAWGDRLKGDLKGEENGVNWNKGK